MDGVFLCPQILHPEEMRDIVSHSIQKVRNNIGQGLGLTMIKNNLKKR